MKRAYIIKKASSDDCDAVEMSAEMGPFLQETTVQMKGLSYWTEDVKSQEKLAILESTAFQTLAELVQLVQEKGRDSTGIEIDPNNCAEDMGTMQCFKEAILAGDFDSYTRDDVYGRPMLMAPHLKQFELFIDAQNGTHLRYKVAIGALTVEKSLWCPEPRGVITYAPAEPRTKAKTHTDIIDMI